MSQSPSLRMRTSLLGTFSSRGSLREIWRDARCVTPLEGESSGGSRLGPGVTDSLRRGVGVCDWKRLFGCGDSCNLAIRGDRKGKALDSRMLNLE